VGLFIAMGSGSHSIGCVLHLDLDELTAGRTQPEVLRHFYGLPVWHYCGKANRCSGTRTV
jgi:hypothetical protein